MIMLLGYRHLLRTIPIVVTDRTGLNILVWKFPGSVTAFLMDFLGEIKVEFFFLQVFHSNVVNHTVYLPSEHRFKGVCLHIFSPPIDFSVGHLTSSSHPGLRVRFQQLGGRLEII